MRTLVVFGTRPEAIKLAPVVRALRGFGQPVAVCSSGQQRDLSRRAAALMGIEPDHDLDVMRVDQTPADVVSSVLSGVSELIAETRPDVVVVQGDTSTALAGALAAFHARVHVTHVEAGLRTGDLARPFPEEMNRRTIATVTDLHCAPTESARQNLLSEHVPAERIEVTGNPVVDSLRWAVARARPPAPLADRVGPEGERIGLPLVLVTVHRRESFGAPLDRILEGVRRIAALGRCEVVLPVHPNPHVAGPVRRALADVAGVQLLEPLDYDELAWVLAHCAVVVTDSGGLQEEAPELGKPVVVLREVTERPELLDARAGVLVGHSPERIVRAVGDLLAGRRDVVPTLARHLFGDGQAGVRIARAMLSHFGSERATGTA